MLKSGKFLIAIGLALVVSNSGTSAREVEKIEGFGDIVDEPILNVMDTLERYALGLNLDEALTIEEIQLADKQYMSWPKEQRESIINKLPLMRLLVYSILIPFRNYGQQVIDEEEKFEELYVLRLMTNYKKLRRVYLGSLTSGRYRIKSPKLDKLIDSLAEVKDATPLTVKLVEDALSEYKHFLETIHEIVSNYDIVLGKNFEDLERFLNNLNRGNVMALVKVVFPNVHLLNERNGDSRLRKLFREEAARKGYYVVKDDEGFNKLEWREMVDTYP